ncbi:adenylate/guanylate cyclase domain-containing protein [Thermodesulfobacteriota bacterium]
MTTRKTVTLAILFADVAKSTHLYEKLGDKIAQKLIGSCVSLMKDVTVKYKGTVIKTIGDEVMSTFPSARTAVEAAKEMHQELEELTIEERPGFPPPNIYVGIQWGPVISQEGDVFGDAVNVAARMVSYAKQRQIITTEETVNELTEEEKNSVRWIDKTTIKGKSGEIQIYEVIWERQDLTVMLDSPMEQVELKMHMELQCHGEITEVDDSRPSVTLGRQVHNDVVVNDNRVSRTHARVEYRRGKFFLIDQSTNGTFVVIQNKKKVTLKRDETQLLGNGIIALGREADPDSPEVINYAIKL